MTKEKDVAYATDRIFVDGVVNNVKKVGNIVFAYYFKEARLSTTRGSDMKHNKFVGQFSTIMRALTSKGWDLLPYFDKIDESRAEIENTSLKHILVNIHNVAANKG